MSSQKSKWLLIAVALQIVLFLGFVSLRPEKKSPREESFSAAKQQGELVNAQALWSGAEYVPIEDTEAFRKLAREITLEVKSAKLTPDQKLKLEQAVLAFAFAYAQGDYPLYRKFRTPVKDFKMFPEGLKEQVVYTTPATKPEDLPDDPEKLDLMMWKIKANDQKVFSEVALRGAVCLVEDWDQMGRLPLPHAALQSAADAGFFTVGMPGNFHFTRQPDAELRDHKVLKTAFLSWSMKPVHDKSAVCTTVRWYWSTPDACWLPWQLAVSMTQTMKVQPRF